MIYGFAASVGGDVIAEVTGAAADLDLFVLSSDAGCDGSSCIASSQNGGTDEMVTFATNVGETFFISVDDYAGSGGSFTISLTCGGFELALEKTGTGTGTVISDPLGIDCGSDCQETYGAGTVVTLNHTAAAGSIFTGWSGGGCSGTGACVVNLTADTTITATFDLLPGSCPAATLSCGSVVNSSNTGAGATDIFDQYSCAGFSSLGAEMVFGFSSPDATEVTVNLTNLTVDFDLFGLSNGAGCDENNCFGGSTNAELSDESLGFSATAGATYYLSADEYTELGGNFTIEVICGSAIFGDGFESGDTSAWSSSSL